MDRTDARGFGGDLFGDLAGVTSTLTMLRLRLTFGRGYGRDGLLPIPALCLELPERVGSSVVVGHSAHSGDSGVVAEHPGGGGGGGGGGVADEATDAGCAGLSEQQAQSATTGPCALAEAEPAAVARVLRSSKCNIIPALPGSVRACGLRIVAWCARTR